MKIWKKNLIAAAVLVTVCAGIYVNWLYTKGQATQTLTESLDTEKVMGEDTLELTDDMAAVMNGEEVDTSGNYFAAVRLSRQQARDDAINLLQEAASYEGGTTKDAEASRDLEDIVQTALSEAQIESLIIAKGYQDCVAYMTGDGISVAVAAPEGGLQQQDVAVIADVVMAQSDYTLDTIRTDLVPLLFRLGFAGLPSLRGRLFCVIKIVLEKWSKLCYYKVKRLCKGGDGWI